jgi:hypothetical protein
MASRADEQSRVLGGVVVVAAFLAEALFLGGILARSYWAIAIPVGVVFTFVMSLVIWIGWTIATVPTDASGDPLPTQGGPGAAKATVEADDSVEQA